MNTRSKKHAPEAFSKEKKADRRIAQLEQTLKEAQKALQSTSQKLEKANQALRAGNDKLTLALEGGHMGTWDFDPATGRIQWDRRMARLYGLGEDQVPQTVDGFYAIVHPEDRPAVRRRVERALTETGTYEAQFRIHHPDGCLRWLAARGRVFYDDAGRPIRMLGVNYDITDRQIAEEKLQRLNEALEEKIRQRTDAVRRSREEIRRLSHLSSTAEERERRRIAEGLHDDVQQLLAACTFSLQSMGLEGDRAEIQRRIHKIAEWCGKALEATRTLIFDLSPAVLYEVGLEAAVSHLTDQIKERFDFDVYLITEGTIDPLPEDLRVFLYSAIRELVLNVFHHADVNEARVWLSREENRIRVQVTDHGRGFKPAEVEEMRKKRDGPARLGLVTLEERLVSYGGRLDLTAAPGEGANIRIAVPVQNGYTDPAKPEISA